MFWQKLGLLKPIFNQTFLIFSPIFCYSFGCNFPRRYVNGFPERKTLSLKYKHLKLSIQTSQFYMRSWLAQIAKKVSTVIVKHNSSLNENLDMAMQQISA